MHGGWLTWAAATPSHADPVAPLLLGLALVLVAAKIGGAIAVRLRQPAVLGELLVGVLLGNLVLSGFGGFEFLRLDAHGHGSLAAQTLDMLARVGVILLLFEVGLESDLSQMRRVGASSLLVALLGVAAPFGLGFLAGRWLLPEASWHVPLFLGATLTATSVGITARVLKDLGSGDSPVAKIVLGAAVIDDVLGLLVLAVVQALIVEGTPSLGQLAWIILKAALFLVGSLLLGEWLSPRWFRAATWLRGEGLLVVTGLVFCFALAWLAGLMGLAPIVGAFAAGLVLDEKHYRVLALPEQSLEEVLLPLSAVLVPVFFVMMGFQVDLRSFASPSVLGVAAVLSLAAVIGKLACAAGVLDRQVDRLSVGIGMIPRGEVGLIFAAIGQGLAVEGRPLIDAGLYTAIVVMVMLTTLITPPLLGWSLRRTKPSGG